MRRLFLIHSTGLLVLLVLGMAQNAQAVDLLLTPTSGVLNTSRFVGSQTSQAQIDVAINAICGCVPELYKQDVGGGESGSLTGSYSATFQNIPNDPSGFTITYTGGPSVGATAWLLVKDGNQNPGWYLFNLTALGWNGTDTIIGTNFWPGEGAVSHVALYRTTSVPEPSSIVLIGLALVGMGVARRRWLQM